MNWICTQKKNKLWGLVTLAIPSSEALLICQWQWVFGQHHGSHWRLICVGIKSCTSARGVTEWALLTAKTWGWGTSPATGQQPQRSLSERNTRGKPSSIYSHFGVKLRANGTRSGEASDELLPNFSKRCLQLDSGKQGAQLCHTSILGSWLLIDMGNVHQPAPMIINGNKLGHVPTNRTPQCQRKREVFLKGKW